VQAILFSMSALQRRALIVRIKAQQAIDAAKAAAATAAAAEAAAAQAATPASGGAGGSLLTAGGADFNQPLGIAGAAPALNVPASPAAAARSPAPLFQTSLTDLVGVTLGHRVKYGGGCYGDIDRRYREGRTTKAASMGVFAHLHCPMHSQSHPTHDARAHRTPLSLVGARCDAPQYVSHVLDSVLEGPVVQLGLKPSLLF